MTVSVRPAEPSDVKDMARIYNQACDRDPLEQVCYSPGLIPSDLKEREAYFDKLLSRDSGANAGGRDELKDRKFVVAIDEQNNHQVVGFAEWRNHASTSTKAKDGKMDDKEICIRLMGKKQHYHLESLYILLEVEKQGVAPQLINYGIQEADKLCAAIFLPLYLARRQLATSLFFSAFGFDDGEAILPLLKTGGGEHIEDKEAVVLPATYPTSQLIRQPMGVCVGFGDNQIVQ